ncbi:MAG TPA: hypothetical protein ENG87_05750 [Candidatus Pacearchaeota archaeon]|nr:hypothetical protein [Candidatus Pacearchaeota archaeon]HDZ61115.1 hypothetical protein [Candidatus Pacearchaeota archaeon]
MEEVEKAYLKCCIKEGMFSDEYIVEAELYDGSIVSGFFPRHLVDKKGLEIKLIKKDENKALVMAPHLGFMKNGSEKNILVDINNLVC